MPHAPGADAGPMAGRAAPGGHLARLAGGGAATRRGAAQGRARFLSEAFCEVFILLTGKGKRFGSVDDLMADLRADD